jgi:hypothetical protein
MGDGLEAKLRLALSNAEDLRRKRTSLAVALAESATAFHRAMKHPKGDWRGNCQEPECLKAWMALSTHGEKS